MERGTFEAGRIVRPEGQSTNVGAYGDSVAASAAILPSQPSAKANNSEERRIMTRGFEGRSKPFQV